MSHPGPPESKWEIGGVEISIFSLSSLKWFLSTKNVFYFKRDYLVLGHQVRPRTAEHKLPGRACKILPNAQFLFVCVDVNVN